MKHLILLIGCGHLGQAMLRRWLLQAGDLSFIVVKPSAPPADLARHERIVWRTLPPRDEEPDAIVYAARPQQVAEILPAYRKLAAHAVTISVAAGIPMDKLARHLGPAAIVRAMPNLSAQIGLGMTAAVANPVGGDKTKMLADRLLRAMGDVIWMDDEKQMDAISALSGSGPAYLFLLADAMAEAGAELGIDPKIAARLARHTIYGASLFMMQDSRDPAALCQAVQSEGGTTEAAMTRLLAEDGMKPMIRDAMRRAAARAAKIGE